VYTVRTVLHIIATLGDTVCTTPFHAIVKVSIPMASKL